MKLEVGSRRESYYYADSLFFITVSITDNQGTFVPNASNPIQFSVTGNAKIVGTDNGYQADTACLKNTNRDAWKGKALVILRLNGKKGNITLKASSPGLAPAILHL
jgi:beta-galactosidase